MSFRPPDRAPTDPPTAEEAAALRRRAARTFVVTMGVVSLFGDMTYEAARGLVGPYLALLGASATAVGFAAGFGEFLGYALRLFTGWLSDRTRAYWPLVIAGYAFNLVAVPGLALVGGWQAALVLVLLERTGKAVRSPARSTLVSYAANEAGAGKSFGIEEALDQIGAVSGPLLTAAVIWGARREPVVSQYRFAFAFLLLPALLNLAFVWRARRRYPTPEALEGTPVAGSAPPVMQSVAKNPLFRLYVVGAMFLGLGFADWALVAYHATRAGSFGPGALPVVYAAVMAADAVAALLAGVAFDRAGLVVLALGTLVSAAATPLVFLGHGTGAFVAGVACWAVGMGSLESIFKAVIARLVPKAQRGGAYGIFYAFFGLAWWLGSSALGWLYGHSRGGLVALSLGAQVCAALIFAVLARKLVRSQ